MKLLLPKPSEHHIRTSSGYARRTYPFHQGKMPDTRERLRIFDAMFHEGNRLVRILGATDR